MDARHFAGRLKELREAAGLTQKELADKIGSSVRSVSRLETGTQEATWPVVVALAQALGVDCRAFLEEPASMPEPKRGRPPKQSVKSPEATKLSRRRDRPKREK